jgi:hypothetical protein
MFAPVVGSASTVRGGMSGRVDPFSARQRSQLRDDGQWAEASGMM